MSRADDKPLCPVGEPECRWLDEIRALRLKNAELLEKTLTDELTGLYNFRYFRTTLTQEMERTRRAGSPTSLIMIDLDHFKNVNDSWGHENGNRVLQQTARITLDALRKIDIASRFGGEEFALILPNTHIWHAAQVAERIRGLLEGTAVETDQGAIHYTASFGVDVYSHADTITAEEFVERTDSLLYQAKKSGRNCVIARVVDDESPVTQKEKDLLLKR